MKYDWKPIFLGDDDAWRATNGDMIDGRAWDSYDLCQAYIDGIVQGRMDAGNPMSDPMGEARFAA